MTNKNDKQMEAWIAAGDKATGGLWECYDGMVWNGDKRVIAAYKLASETTKQNET